MSSSNTSSKIPWSGLVVAALTVALLWWFVKDLSLDELRNAFATANLWLIAAAVLTTVQTSVVRAWRWQVMLAPIGTVRFSPAFRTTIIGFTATFLLPARVGEVLRPYLLAKQERLSVSATFATIIVERALDLTAVLLLFACSMPFLGVDVGAETRWAGGLAAVAALVGLGVLFACAGHPERLGLLVDRLTGWLPTRIASALGAFARRFAEGLGVMRDPTALIKTMAWSVVLWVSICLGIWFVTLAFDLTMPFAGAFLVVMYLVVGVAAPTPGGAGGFHVMYKLAVTQYFAAGANAAAAAAIMLHLVSFVPVAILGFVFMWQDGLTLGSLKRMNTKEADPS
jgi:uncharacterized protein (TIRG00374 family)